ncbi:hypothetical protein, partial [Algimonas porphyrae]
MTTVDGWRLTCGSANNGQGFIGHSPDGTQYRFDRFYTVEADYLGSRSSGTVEMARTRNILAATQVTDVNGNTVNYDYDTLNRLTAIRASDGRRINLNYSGSSKIIQSATVNPGTAYARTWSYAYQQKSLSEYPATPGPIPNSLVTVIQPDGRSWSYDLGGMSVDPGPNYTCRQLTQNLTVTHPYGVTGTFRLIDTRQRIGFNLQEDISLGCPGFNEITPGNGQPPQVLERAGIMSLVRKRLNGPGLPQHEWNFSYEEDNGAPGSSSSDRTNTSSVTEPSGRVIVYRHYWTAEPLGGKLATKVTKDGATVLRNETYSYVKQPTSFGFPTHGTGSTPDSTFYPTHTSSTVISQDGDSYTSTQQYDVNTSSSTYSWGRPITSISTSSFSGTRTINHTYEHNSTKWILGLPKTTTFQGKPWESLTYDANGRVATYSKFGILRGSYTYHTGALFKGALHTVTNALGHTASFSNWHRGKPQTITRWDGRTLYRTVNDNGWELTTTDANGHQTAYGYNAMGWLDSVNPPGSFFNTANLSYSFNPSSSVAMRQTVIRGAGTTTVDYDGLFRPMTTHRRATDASSAPGGLWEAFAETRYDLAGNTVFQSRPSVSAIAAQTNGVISEYDLLKRLIRTEDSMDSAVVSTLAYSSLNRTTATNPSGHVTTTFKDGFNGPGKGAPLRIDEPGRETLLSYDMFGNLIQLTQNDLISTQSRSVTQYMRHDDRMRLCRHFVPEHGETRFSYDAADRLTSHAKGQGFTGTGFDAAGNTDCASNLTDSGKSHFRIETEYSPMGWVEATDFADSATLDIENFYDWNGNLQQTRRGFINAGTGTMPTASVVNELHRIYDELNNVLSETQQIDGAHVAFMHQYSYDANVFMKSRRYSSNNLYEWTNDSFGHQQHMRQGSYYYANNITYHPDSSLAGYLMGNSQSYTRTVDPLQRTDRIRSVGGLLTALDLDYSYNSNSQITAILDASTP